MSNSTLNTHPRPQLSRERWHLLDGPWQFGIGESEASIDATIAVPFAPETPASGVNAKGYFDRCWYRRKIATPAVPASGRLMLYFEAADYQTRVWANGQYVGEHEGGYTRFGFDITEAVAGRETMEILVRCDDDPHDLAKPRGKQDWLPEAHAIWYPRTTGLWQSVWLEVVPTLHVTSLRWTADAEAWTISLHATLNRVPPKGTQLAVTLKHKDEPLVEHDILSFNKSREVRRTFHLADGGIDDIRDRLMWTPDRPNLIHADCTLFDDEAQPLDEVQSYTAMRSVGILGDRFILNSRPAELRLVLDQGYWYETGLTPPNDEALRRDIELVKAMGFNGVRKHQKIESERFLYLADVMGLFVWEEMPSPYVFTGEMIRRTTAQWIAAIERDISHPCIIAWVPINESWGVPDLPLRADQRAFVKSLYSLTKSLDSTRPVVSNDGWEMTETDLFNIHDYDHDPARLAARLNQPMATQMERERPGRRVLAVEKEAYRGQPVLLTEFGGIALSADAQATWGYSRAISSADLAGRYARLLDAVRRVPILSGFCYTQFTDTYQEANGLLMMDRTPKFPLEQIAVATRGAHSPAEQEMLKTLIATK